MATQSYPAIQPTDSELLMQFTTSGDEAAFRALVERHGGLVHSVCRRVLQNEQDVEDAFQATFLVLARRARSIRSTGSAAAWLFRVAHRTAVRAAIESGRRQERPLNDEPEIPSPTFAQIQEREAFELLAAELNRLPENYRSALILFYLEGKSRDAAAEELECTDAALKARLARGRQMLRQRLMRRGIALSLVLTAAAASSRAAEASLATGLIDRTVSAGLQYAATGKAGAACSANSVSLAQGANPMASATLVKSSTAIGMLLSAGLLVAVGIGAHQLGAEQQPKAGASAKGTIETVVRDAAANQSSKAGTTIASSDAVAPKPKSPRPDVAQDNGSDAGQSNDVLGNLPIGGPSQLNRRQNQSIDLKRMKPAEEKIEAALTEATQIEFIDTSLQDALEFISDLHKIQIIIDESALAEEGIATDEPITQVLSGIALESALNIMFRPLGLTYLIEDEVMKITTEVAEQERLETRVYVIGDLTSAGFDEETLKRIIEKQTGADVETLPGHLVITESQQQHRQTRELFQQLHRATPIRE